MDHDTTASDPPLAAAEPGASLAPARPPSLSARIRLYRDLFLDRVDETLYDWRTGIYYSMRLKVFLRPYIWLWIAGLATGAIYSMWVAALLPALDKSLTLLEQHHIKLNAWQLAIAGGAVPVYFIIRAGLGYISAVWLMRVAMGVLKDLRDELFRNVQRMSMDFFAHNDSARIMQLVVQRTKMVAQSITDVVGDLVKTPLTIVSVIAMMMTRDAIFTLIAMAFIPLSLIPGLVLGYLVRHKGRAEDEAEAGSIHVLGENLRGVHVVKSYAREADECARFRRASERENAKRLEVRKMLEAVNPLVEIFASFGFGAALVYGYYRGMGISTLVQLAAGLFLLYDPFKRIGKLYTQLQRIMAALERVFDLFDMEPRITNRPGAVAIASARGLIEFRGVQLDYREYGKPPKVDAEALGLPREPKLRVPRPKPPKEKFPEGKGGLALRGIDIAFEPGKFYALVGPSGAGKTSIFSLILRFYDPTEGAVLLDGQDLRDLDMHSLRRQVGLVSQETFLFNDTVRENIRYGRLDATEEDIRAAAARAHADEFVQHLTGGYEAEVGENGRRLSGGQQQRVSIARAFLKNAPILLLDEATSALDAESAAKVQDAIDDLAVGRTVIAIAHRLRTVQRADEIIVMDQGVVAARGKHDDLMRESELYKRLCELELAG
ncbi:MAG: ABC transporter ATP-binding protein [Verrucomicrobiae bacterium]|nr:ABC transporter ATP-binding protein [Verrucomicrobiae bacterium]